MTVFALREASGRQPASSAPAPAIDRPGVGHLEHISVELADAARFAALAEAWMSLAARAGVPNAFMDPAVALAMAEAWPDPVRILLAWALPERGAPAQLVGAWLLIERRTRLSWPYRALVSPVCSVAYLGTPVIDPEHARAAFAAMFATIRKTPALPKLVDVGDLSDDQVLMGALKAALSEGVGGWAQVERRRRAKLETQLDAKAYWTRSMSDHHRHDLARLRRRLSERGKLEFRVVRDPDAVAAEVEEFLVLEASGWKAARHSALACDPATARFTRVMTRGLASRGLVAVHSLRLDDRPISSSIVLYSGTGAFTWRTSYDESYRRFSPGILTLEGTTTDLLSDPSVRSTDSCNHLDIGFQAQRWAERHEIVDLVIDLGSKRPWRLALLVGRERCLRRCKALARQAYHALRRRKAELTVKLRRWTERPGSAA
ncbi:acetyltransferase (GNAT) family protein [Bosea sp. BK604]|nr:acetyltransferase (GNAT) family protein [Bosea sp. BK604]